MKKIGTKCAKKVKDPARVKAAKKAWVTIRKNKRDSGQAPLDNFGVFGPKDKSKNKKIDKAGTAVDAVGKTEWTHKKKAKTIKEIVKEVKRGRPKKSVDARVVEVLDWHVTAAKKAWKTIRRNKALKHKRMSEIAKKRWADMKKRNSVKWSKVK